MISGFPVFANQPFLKELEQFILTDLGSHTLDAARFLFGEASSLYCQTRRVHQDIKGEDVATVVMQHGRGHAGDGQHGLCGKLPGTRGLPSDLPFYRRRARLAGAWAGLLAAHHHPEGTLLKRVPPPRYAWADPAYEVVHASIVPCNANLLAALKG